MKTHNIGYLLIFSAMWGGIVGMMHPHWQLAIEGGQVWAGLVDYPLDNPNFMYLNHAWTMVHQATGLLLYAGLPEKLLSLFISGLIGFVSCMAISGLMFYFSRSILFSTLFPVLYYLIEKQMHLGANYPIMLWDVPHTYGALSFSIVLLIVSLWLLNKHRLAGFLLGLLPSLHIAWAFFVYLVMTLIQVKRWCCKQDNLLQRIMPAFICGSLISLISFMDYQYHLIQYPEVMQMKPFIKAFQQWDCHRMPLPVTHPAIWINIIAIIYSIFCLQSQSFTPRVLAYEWMIACGVLGLVGALLSYLPNNMYLYIYRMIPTRVLNVNVVFLIACCAGQLNINNFRGAVLVVLTCVMYLSGMMISFWAAAFTISGVFFGITWIKEIFSKQVENWIQHDQWKYIPLFLMVIIHCQFIVQHISNISKFIFHKDLVIEEVKKTKGILLTASNIMLIQARTRKPVLLYGESLDMVMYAMASMPTVSHILNDIYGISWCNPPESVLHKGGLTSCIDQKLWESRSLDQWIEIKEKYNVSYVLTYASYQLNLKLVEKNSYYGLYRLP
ncbi:MAG: hypothetical protein OMM_00030 [Candidatus Magnetoglobus multicellularis str. Araruama]|uniref:Uncharacterized protein n=1 Tax=Candidatus Magnetoglobus multicellularis str. Araruama TaxID=890399 RepID=A0A1V1PIG6_9BACT|nr:MAG: hypothetical protein OMM_00030 [Candidatus Magnetoglobus multicellularis str. Araruama]